MQKSHTKVLYFMQTEEKPNSLCVPQFGQMVLLFCFESFFTACSGPVGMVAVVVGGEGEAAGGTG